MHSRIKGQNPLVTDQVGFSEESLPSRFGKWSQKEPPMVSICTLAYNHEKYVVDAIESFLNQEVNFKIEILIHDDASEDNTAEIISKYRCEYPHLIKTLIQTKNQYSQGVDPEWNFLIPMAKGKYIALCEGDDYWTDPLKLQKQVDFLESHPDYSVCVGGYTSYMETEKSMGSTHITSMDNDTDEGFTFSLEEMKHAWLTKLLTSVVRRDILESYDATVYKYHRDIHFFYHLIKGHKAYYMRENFGVHRVHPGGVNSMRQGVVNSRAAYNCYRELYEHNRDEFTRHMHLKTSLGFFNFNLYNRYEDNSVWNNLRMYGRAILLVRSLTEAKWLFTAFIKASLKEKMKEVIG
jgi:glycosyltransferase involved in cell wall biosynthesis